MSNALIVSDVFLRIQTVLIKLVWSQAAQLGFHFLIGKTVISLRDLFKDTLQRIEIEKKPSGINSTTSHVRRWQIYPKCQVSSEKLETNADQI